jgi:hypothetical protein
LKLGGEKFEFEFQMNRWNDLKLESFGGKKIREVQAARIKTIFLASA